jgi:hypothetical protein
MSGRNVEYDLRNILTSFTVSFPYVDEIFIFGSRRHLTRSTRSDVDLLISSDKHLVPEDVRDYAIENCPIIDFFIIDGPTARSCANGSMIKGSSRRNLINKLDAVRIWRKSSGFHNGEIEWIIEVLAGYVPPMTTVEPDGYLPYKIGALASRQSKRRTRIIDGFKDIALHPIAICAYCVLISVTATYATVDKLIITPLRDKQLSAQPAQASDQIGELEIVIPRVALTRSPDVEWGASFIVEGRCSRLLTEGAYRIYVFVRPHIPPNSKWWIQQGSAKASPDETWKASGSTGSSTYPVQVGDLIDVVALAGDPAILDNFDLSKPVDRPQDIPHASISSIITVQVGALIKEPKQ